MSKHQRTLHREAPSIDISSRRAAEETAWRIKSVKLQRDRHAQQRHLNPLNMADTFGHFIASFKGRHQDAILVIGEVCFDFSLQTLSLHCSVDAMVNDSEPHTAMSKVLPAQGKSNMLHVVSVMHSWPSTIVAYAVFIL